MILFALAYNYVLDPSIRRSLSLDLKGSVVVLDEAHNIEDTLCTAGSGDYGEIELFHLISVLTQYSNQGPDRDSVMELLESKETLPVSEVAHDLLLFLERLTNHMYKERNSFEQGQGEKNLQLNATSLQFAKLMTSFHLGLERVKREHARFRLGDDYSLEVSYHGPSGYGLRGEAVGCEPILHNLEISPELCRRLHDKATSLENHLFGGEMEPSQDELLGQKSFKEVVDFIGQFEMAAKNPE